MTYHPPEMIQYEGAPHYTTRYPKSIVVGHNTVSPTSAHMGGRRGVDGDFRHWINTRKSKGYNLGTAFIGDADGKVYQGFSSEQWAHHIGARSSEFKKRGLKNINRWLNQVSIGFELDCLGPLEFAPDGNGFWTAVKDYQKGGFVSRIRIPKKNVIYYPDGFRGYQLYERFTDEQIETYRQTLLYLCEYHAIPTTYNEDQWDVSERALKGAPGIWQHVSYRADKTDCHPQPELIEMLKSLHPKKTMIPAIPRPYTPLKVSEIEIRKATKEFVKATGGFDLSI